jgi:hypothetical protein
MTPVPQTNPVADKLRELISTYWDLAYAEGQAGRTTDTPNGDAQQVHSEIEAILSALTAAPREVVGWQVYNEQTRQWASLNSREEADVLARASYATRAVYADEPRAD